MKRYLLSIISVFLFASCAWAFSPALMGVVTGGVTGGIPLVQEDFEGTGTPAGWTLTAGTNPDYTTSPLSGVQSLYIDDSGEPRSATSPNFTDSGIIYGHFLFRTNFTSATYRYICIARNGATDIFNISITNSLVRIINGTIGNTASYAIAANTQYHIWYYFNATTKSGSLYIGTTTERPDTPTVSLSGGNASITTVNNIKYSGMSYSGAGNFSVFDNIKVSNSVFTSVSP